MEAVFCVWALTKFFILLNCQVLRETNDINHHLLGIIVEIYVITLVNFGLRPKHVYHYIPMCFFNFITFILDTIYCYYIIIYDEYHYIIFTISCILHLYETYMFCNIKNDQHKL